MFNILVLCTGNSARSILAEAVLNRDGAGRVAAYSAGSNPTGRVNPGAIRLLERRGLPTTGYRSKSWDEFAAPGSPAMDLVVTVCASAAGEVCPIWPGAPMTTHWGVDDPAAAPDDQIDLAFQLAYHRLSARINAFLALPFEDMAPDDLRPRLRAIGEMA
ncbi:MAG: arsenate reductase ArsC [Pseudomonadota bacterium]